MATSSVPSTRRVLGVKRVSRCRAAFESVDAEAVIVSARAAELFVDLGYKLAQLVHLAEIEGSSGDVEHLAGRHAVFAHGQVRVGVDADELVVDLPAVVPGQVEVAVVRHVDDRLGIVVALMRYLEGDGPVVFEREPVGHGEGAITR